MKTTKRLVYTRGTSKQSAHGPRCSCATCVSITALVRADLEAARASRRIAGFVRDGAEGRRGLFDE